MLGLHGDPSPNRITPTLQSGFTFIEVLVALAATVIVMGVVFGLLAQGSGAQTEGLERTDLQAQARIALQMVSHDVLLAGGDLPPEFPSFHPVEGSSGVRSASPNGIEIIGSFDEDAAGGGAVPVSSFDGRVARLGTETGRFRRGELVLVYDDEPVDGKWMFGLVASITPGPQSELSLLTGAGERIDDVSPPIRLPDTIDSYNRPLPEFGFVTPVSVIRYGLDTENDAPDLMRTSMWRQVNWGERLDVAYVENLEIRYFVGATVVGPEAPGQKPQPRGPSLQGQGVHGPKEAGKRNPTGQDPGSEQGLVSPPPPQPWPSRAVEESAVIHGVRITVTARSRMANLRGSSLRDGQSATDDGFLRETLSTRVAPRNLVIQAERRLQEMGSSEPEEAPDPSRRPRR